MSARRPIISLQGGYDIELKWEHDGPNLPDPEKVISAVRDQLGLELTLAKRPVEENARQGNGLTIGNRREKRTALNNFWHA